ncbi:NAD(P)H-hydrate dehydratase [Sphingomonas sp. BT-65]|uniref:NAD(P)H-hydrate dehydratase n=1 Tax=Sphingomonas sp. BT-65 TaxID=2989821 RepID=UPI002235CA96|nr:NAD(P)H-hydrate dehydratase [Sphingomonas sp. BT-65]MCW4461067.1 NAD(P)H-hydrate dehydratase [Sphingomonas sp. BT-65]
MRLPEGAPILTAAQMRAAEDRAIADGASVTTLMERAGTGVAETVHRLAAGGEVLILCGPGNNGGDGYVAARVLANHGMRVRVAALGDPRTEAAAEARNGWIGPVEAFPGELPGAHQFAPVIVDAVFGTGLSRPVDAPVATAIKTLADHARLSIAVDLPSGVETDTGGDFDRGLANFGVTLALGALKPAHLLQPAAAHCGTVHTIDIGLERDETLAEPTVRTLSAPRLAKPQPSSHKYSRGMVAIISGPMHGASELAALAAYRAGAGYVLLLTGGLPHPPHAIVRQRWSADALDDKRVGAVVIGPGLGRDDRAREKLDAALASPHPLVIDGDALHLLDLDRLVTREAPTVLTPHAGEFAALFGEVEGSKIARTQHAARRSNAVVVFKGADTVIVAPDGSANVALPASGWLSVAGTGDVLAGAIATMLAQNTATLLEAASAGVWLHAEAARLLDRCFLADELADALPHALARTL